MKSSWKWHGPITIQNSFWYCALFFKWKVKGRPWTIQQIYSLVWVQIHSNGTGTKNRHKNIFFTGTHSSLWNRMRFTKIPQPEAHILPFGTECNFQKYHKPTQKFVLYRYMCILSCGAKCFLQIRKVKEFLCLGIFLRLYNGTCIPKPDTKICLYRYHCHHRRAQCFLSELLRGYCTPGQFLDCFCIFLKNYNTLVTSKICFL